MKYFLSMMLLCVNIIQAGAVQPAEYRISDDVNVSYIYSPELGSKIATISANHKSIIDSYERSYGYGLDQRLFVILASQHDQIANGFSAPVPLNEQVLYGGGVARYDYFSTTSWYQNLLIHETAHNFQLTPGENPISRFARRLSGGTIVTRPLFIPMLPYPNVMESSYILEGNAVLNESLWSNGGRLYSGYGLAETVVQARSGNIIPEKLYNFRYRFPGGEKFYLIGGHFQKFLAKRYGVNKVNDYFRTFSRQPLPLFGNSVFRKHYGKDFVMLTKEFATDTLSKHRDFRASEGKVIARSQIPVPLEKTGSEIYTLIADKKSAPKVLRYDIHNRHKSTVKGSWRAGGVIKTGGRYYTQASARISPTRIAMGLYDTDGYIKRGTASKVIQGYKSNGQEVYLSVSRSWDQPHLYVGNRYYGVVNSSVLVHGNDLYYFKQSGSKRVLYRNHTRLTAFEGYYGFVSDVDSASRVYFTAGSKHGSTVYKYDPSIKKLQRVSRADDIISFKLSGSNEAIVQTITADGYEIKQIRLHPITAKVAMYNIGLPQKSLGHIASNYGASSSVKKYNPLAQLRFSSLVTNSAYNSQDGYSLSIKAHLTDPLWQNSLSFVMKYQKQRTLFGASYTNSAHWLRWGGGITAVKKHAGYDNSKYRDVGYSAYLSLPFFASGYWRGSLGAALSKPYNDPKRSPMSVWVDIIYRKQFGYSKYPNHYFSFSGFVERDGDAAYAGAGFGWMHDMPNQSYIEIKGAYMYSSKTDPKRSKGIKAGKTSSTSADRATIHIPTLGGKYYLKQAVMAGVGLYKVFDYEWLNYHLPVSLLRENIYIKHNIYKLKFQNGSSKTIHESIAGVEGDVLMFHKGVVPVKLELLYNNDAKKKVQLRVGAEYRF